MFEKRNISKEEAVRRACKQNGLEYVPADKRKPKKTITLVDEQGNESVIDNKLNVVKAEEKVKIEEMITLTKSAYGTILSALPTTSRPKVGGYRVASNAGKSIAAHKGSKVASKRAGSTVAGSSKKSSTGVGKRTMKHSSSRTRSNSHSTQK